MKPLTLAWLSGSLLLMFPLVTEAQYHLYNSRFYETRVNWQAGLSLGSMNCLTDLGGKKGKQRFSPGDVNWKQSHLCGGFFGALEYQQQWGIILAFTLGEVSASDADLTNQGRSVNPRLYRNLHFKTAITEGLALLEMYPLQLFSTDKPATCRPYILAGLGMYHFNPLARDGEDWTSLKALHTEGQGFKDYPDRKNYSLLQVNLPLGMGLEMAGKRGIRFSVEVLYRKLFTDYLDDVSTGYITPTSFTASLDRSRVQQAIRLADRKSELPNNPPAKAGDKRGNPHNKDGYFSCCLKTAISWSRPQ